MSELLEEIASKQAHAILEVRNGKKLKHLKEAEEGEEEREVSYRDPETGKLGKKKIKVPRQIGMNITTKTRMGTAAKARTKKDSPNSPAKGSKEYDTAIKQAKDEYEAWEKEGGAKRAEKASIRRDLKAAKKAKKQAEKKETPKTA